MRGARRYEISTSGIDQALQGVYSDPFGGINNVGLIIPSVVPTTRPKYRNRLTFTLAWMRLGAGRVVHVVGVRQLLTIAAQINASGDSPTGTYILEKQVTTPFWHFTDGSVSWSINRVQPGRNPLPHVDNTDSVAFTYAQGSALVFRTNPGLATYTPPAAGRPLGTPIAPSLGNIHDLRWPWNDPSQESMRIEVQGPCDLVFTATVQQTNPSTRTTLLLPSTLPGGTECLPSEDAFVANFPNTSGTPTIVAPIYWRIGGSLVVEEANDFPWPRELQDDTTAPWCPPTSQRGGTRGGSIVPPEGDSPRAPTGGDGAPKGAAPRKPRRG